MAGLELLTSAEQDAAKRPGARQRALALLVLERWGTLTGLLAEELVPMAETVRSMNKKSAKKFREGLTTALGVLEKTQSKPEPEAPDSPEPSVAPLPSFGLDDVEETPVYDDTKPESAPSVDEVPDVVTGDVKVEVARPVAFAEYLGQISGVEVDNDPVVVSKSVQLFIKETTGLDIDTYTPLEAISIIETIIHNGFLPALRMRQDGTRIDATERLLSFFELNGNLQALSERDGSSPATLSQWFGGIRRRARVAHQERREEVTEPTGNLDEDQDADDVTPGTPLKDGAIEEMPSPAISFERPLNEEPVHVREAVYFAELLHSPKSYVDLKSLFNPEVNDRLGAGAIEAIHVINELLDSLSAPGGDILNDDRLNNPKGKAVLRRLLGRFSDYEGRRIVKAPERLAGQFRQDRPGFRDEKIAAFYETLPQLREILKTPPVEQTILAETEPKKPIYRVNSEGRVTQQ